MFFVRIIILLLYRLLPKKKTDFSLGLIEKLNLLDDLRSQNYETFEQKMLGLHHNEMSRALEGLTSDLTHQDLIEPYLENHDSEFRNLMEGIYETRLAWESRTAKRAKHVKDDQWKGFFEHLQKAVFSLEEVEYSNPRIKAEAQARMIRVNMGFSEKEDAFDCFEAATQQFDDHVLAHTSMFKTLMPRWLGSEDAIYQFSISRKHPEMNSLMKLFYLIEMYDLLTMEYDSTSKCKRLFRRNHKTMALEVIEQIKLKNDDSYVDIYTKNYLAFLYHILGKRSKRNKLLRNLGQQITFSPWASFGMQSKRDIWLFRIGRLF